MAKARNRVLTMRDTLCGCTEPPHTEIPLQSGCGKSFETGLANAASITRP
jgi:hypothetical protein